MSDFSFIKNPFLNRWVIIAPRRAKKPDETKEKVECPFEDEKEDLVFKLNEVKVVANKYPFAPIHEVIIHSKDHDKNFEDLNKDKVEDILRVYKQRFLEHMPKGQVYIFHNRGGKAGESIKHPHTQLVVIPKHVTLAIPPLAKEDEDVMALGLFNIFCPLSSDWPDEVWIYPKQSDRMFGDIRENEIEELSTILQRLIKLFTLRHEGEFPFNFYIYPGKNWYLRLMPRIKTLGGFEIGTDIFVNTQDPRETIKFIKDYWNEPRLGIDDESEANYHKAV